MADPITIAGLAAAVVGITGLVGSLINEFLHRKRQPVITIEGPRGRVKVEVEHLDKFDLIKAFIEVGAAADAVNKKRLDDAKVASDAAEKDGKSDEAR